MIEKIIVSDAMSLMREQGNKSVPLIIADPPYGIGYHSNHYKGRNPHAPIVGDWNFQIGQFFQECARILIDGGALYLFCRWDVSPLWIPAIAPSGLKLKTVIVWVKNNWSAGDLAGCFGNQYEQILFIVKGRHLIRGKRWSNVWEFPRVPVSRMLCPAQKPTPLLRRAIEASSDEGDIVVDPFCGSGSTGEAAHQTGRVFILGDVDSRMVNIARARLNFPLLDTGWDDAVSYTEYLPEFPTLKDWGIHPEDLRLILDELQGNLARETGQLEMAV